MKRLGACLLAMVLLVCAVPSVSAQEPEMRVISETTEYAPDGSCIVTTLSEEVVENVGIARAGYNKTGSKTITSKDSDGAVRWTFTVTGTFVVNEGVVSACITAR